MGFLIYIKLNNILNKIFRRGAKRKRDDDEAADTTMDMEEEGDSRSGSGVTAVPVPKGQFCLTLCPPVKPRIGT